MKRKSYRKQRRRVAQLFDTWTYRLGLRWWTIRVLYYNRRKRFKHAADHETFARVYADWRYLNATIEINLPCAKRLDDAELEAAVVHELCHILVNEMSTTALRTTGEEHVCTTLAQAFIWTRTL